MKVTEGDIASGDLYSRDHPFLLARGSGGAAALTRLPVAKGTVVSLELFRTSSDGEFAGVRFYVNLTPASDRPRSTLVDPAGGTFASTAIAGQCPAICCWSNTGNLIYVRAKDAGGYEWEPAVTVVKRPAPGEFTSLEMVEGNPAICFYDTAPGRRDLVYVRAKDASGLAWEAPVTVTGTGDAGAYNSMRIVAGRPAISFYNNTNGTLEYVRANDAAGQTWGPPVTVDAVKNVNAGAWTSLQIIKGNPAISYYDNTNGQLKYVRASDSEGTAWGPPVVASAATFTGLYASMHVVDGYPAIAYYHIINGNSGSVEFVRARDALGAKWDEPVVLHSAGNAGGYTSLQILDGKPAVSFYDGPNGDLRMVCAAGANGSAWFPSAIVESTGRVGRYSSLLVVNGIPGIAYYDETNAGLRYAHPGANTFHNWRALHFGTTENAGDAADDADPDGDGLVNLIEFATGADPNIPNAPYLQIRTIDGNLEITFTRSNDALCEAGLTVECSDSPAGPWTAPGDPPAVLSDDGISQRVASKFPMSTSRKFARLKAVR